jgi:hypothetical protein
LFDSLVDGRCVGREIVDQVLLFVLLDGGGERFEEAEEVPGDGEGDGGFWGEGFGEVDDVVLCRPADGQSRFPTFNMK